VLRQGVLDGLPAEYVGPTLSDPAITDFGRAVDSAILRRQLGKSGLDSGRQKAIVSAPVMKKVRMKTAGSVGGDDAESVAIVMLTTMYTVTFLYGMWVMRGAQAEKRSRIAEVLLTVARPVELMAGKLVGIGLAGLTQCLIWVSVTALLTVPGLALGGFELPKLSVGLLLYFVVFFILGYFLYATLFALAGASSTSTDEGQQIMAPLIMLQIVPMMVFFMTLRQPNSTASVALSLIPFFAPTLMLLRLTITQPPIWQIVSSLGLIVITIAGSIWFTAKVYRAGILMSGKPRTLPELIRWLRYS
jgi:ABC-2 type transport system permease protein